MKTLILILIPCIVLGLNVPSSGTDVLPLYQNRVSHFGGAYPAPFTPLPSGIYQIENPEVYFCVMIVIAVICASINGDI